MSSCEESEPQIRQIVRTFFTGRRIFIFANASIKQQQMSKLFFNWLTTEMGEENEWLGEGVGERFISILFSF